MKNIRTFKLSYILLLLLLCSGSIFGQTEQKFKKSYPLNEDARLFVNTQHTNLKIETWNKNQMEVEAFIDTKGLSKDEIAAAMEDWRVNIQGNQNGMEIQSRNSSTGSFEIMLPKVDSIPHISAEFMGPFMNDLLGPMLESISNNPLPPEFMEGVGSLDFDHEAFERDGEKYLEKWEKQMESKFGKDVEIAMEEWSKNFEKNAEAWGAKMEIHMESWGEDFGKDMEKWGESFGKEMEAWGAQFGREMEKWAQDFEQQEGRRLDPMGFAAGSGSSKMKRTLVIKVPKEALLNLNVRYGEVDLADRISNLQAKLSHSKLNANIIDGSKTEIEASYTPVKVEEWNYGILKTNYVKNCYLETAESLKLSSTSSNVRIGELEETGIISGTFGDLEISKLASDFRTLDITLENSDLNLSLPDSALNFLYTGSQSTIDYPSSIKGDPVKSYDSETINGYQKSRNSEGLVNIKASYSNVRVK